MIKLLGLALLVLSTVSLSEDINFNWSTPTEYQNGQAVQEIQGYTLYYFHNNLLQDTISLDASSNSYGRQDVSEGVHTIQIATISDGAEGVKSDPFSLVTPTPKKRDNITVSGEITVTVNIVESK